MDVVEVHNGISALRSFVALSAKKMTSKAKEGKDILRGLFNMFRTSNPNAVSCQSRAAELGIVGLCADMVDSVIDGTYSQESAKKLIKDKNAALLVENCFQVVGRCALHDFGPYRASADFLREPRLIKAMLSIVNCALDSDIGAVGVVDEAWYCAITVTNSANRGAGLKEVVELLPLIFPAATYIAKRAEYPDFLKCCGEYSI